MKVDMGKVNFWIDSMNVLYWTHNQSRLFKSFVENSVGDIQTHTEPSQWRYVSIKISPADNITRGVAVKDMQNLSYW